MKALSRFLAIALLCAVAASPSLAAVEKYKNWDKSPEFQYFATEDEKAAWKKISTEAEAEKFVALFWAMRDPDLKTPQNEFKERVEALVKIADDRFKVAGRRGALTERGRVVIVIGPPRTIIPKDVTPGAGSERAGTDIPVAGARIIQYTFVYEDKWLPAWADQKKFEIVVEVDEGRNYETIINRSAYVVQEKRALKAALAHPELTAPPVYKTREQVEAEQKAAAGAAAEAMKGPSLSPVVRTALEEILAKPAAGPLTVMPIAFRDGSTRLMVQFLVPAAIVTAPDTTKLAVLVRDKAGKDAARLEEAAALMKSKSDLFASRALPVPPGEYDLVAALIDAGGQVLAAGRRAAAVLPVPTEFAASSLLLACNDLEADPRRVDEPFVFSGRRFVARPEGKFDPRDGLAWVVRIYNPAIDPATKTTFLRKTMRIKPKTGSAIDVPGSEEKPIPVPDMKDKGTLILDLAAAIVDENIAEYLPVGDLEFRLTITDQVSGKRLDLSAPFTLTGKLPRREAPAKK